MLMKRALSIPFLLLCAGLVFAFTDADITLYSPSQALYRTTTIPMNLSVTETATGINLTYTNGTTIDLCQNCSESFILLNLPEGDHALIISASNETGSATKSYNFTIDLPPITLLASPAQSLITNQTNHTFACNATDTQGLLSLKLLIWHANGSDYKSNETNISGTNNGISETYTFADGNYTWNCLSQDTVNNSGLDINRTLTVDTVSPTAPSFSCSPSSVTKGETTACSCSGSSDATSGINYNYPASPSTSNNGTFTINCTVIDRAGNSNFALATYTVNNPASSSQQTIPSQTTTTTTATKTTNTTNTSVSGNNSQNLTVNSQSSPESTANKTEPTLAEENTTNLPASVTGAVTGDVATGVKGSTLLAIGSFVVIVLFMASFVTFVRRVVIKKIPSSKAKRSQQRQDKFRKSSILE